MQPTFAEPYPHRVTMVEQMSGVPQVSAAEMVQFCMLQPMQAEGGRTQPLQPVRAAQSLRLEAQPVRGSLRAPQRDNQWSGWRTSEST
jgi:hypothetical protein